MAQSITALANKFDASAIMAGMPSEIESTEFQLSGQLSITHAPGVPSWHDSTGSLYSTAAGKFTRQTKEYNELNSYFKNTYVEWVINEVQLVAAQDNVNIGRIRLMMLKPKTCYSYHWDPEEFRYHIPLITNAKCFFVNDMIIESMPTVGQLYRFRTNNYHTAVNASFESRYHLLFDTFK